MITCVGSIALETTRTKAATAAEIPGGSAVHFALAASLLEKPSIVSCVGADFPKAFLDRMSKRGIDVSNIGIAKDGRTFRFHSTFSEDFQDRSSDLTQLNVFEKFEPKLTPSQKKAKVAFIGTLTPSIQLSVIEQMEKPELVVMDTIEFFIKNNRAGVLDVLSKVDCAIFNESEARMLCKKTNLVECGKEVLKMGPSTCIVKKGEHGSILFTDEGQPHPFPGFPLDHIVDPTGAGDAFAGGFTGYLASCGCSQKKQDLCRAVAWGTVMGSIAVEAFGADSLLKADRKTAQARYDIYRNLMHYEE
jgi:sugar/nucleoside kinase (ribokinase family)